MDESLKEPLTLLKRRIFVAGHRGLVGSAILRSLAQAGCLSPITADRRELNLMDQAAVDRFFRDRKIEVVFLAAAKVGGILANSRFQADFLHENLMIASNVIQASAKYGVTKLLFLGSSCIYPKLAPQPIQETSLLSGPLEPTNEGYAIAKIAGLKLCEMYHRQYGKRFISVMPTNLFGPNDNFHPEHSHVIPGMMRRFHEAKVKDLPSVTVWGSGTPRREFLHVDDLANALLLLMERYEEPQIINVGSGTDCSIRELAQTMSEVTGYKGQIEFDATQPDGTPRKCLDVSRMRSLGWNPHRSLLDGLRHTYQWAVEKNIFKPD